METQPNASARVLYRAHILLASFPSQASRVEVMKVRRASFLSLLVICRCKPEDTVVRPSDLNADAGLEVRVLGTISSNSGRGVDGD